MSGARDLPSSLSTLLAFDGVFSEIELDQAMANPYLSYHRHCSLGATSCKDSHL